MIEHVNWWAILVCGIINWVVGAIWYSPAFFYNAWKTENKLTDEYIKEHMKPARTYGLSLVLSLLISWFMAFVFKDKETGGLHGALEGLHFGFFFCAAIFCVIALFEQKTWRYMAINGGYILVYFTLIGFILGAWR